MLHFLHPHPTCTPVCSEVGVGVPSSCLCPGPCVHLSPGLEVGSHNEELGVWPGLNQALGPVRVGEGRMPAELH